MEISGIFWGQELPIPLVCQTYNYRLRTVIRQHMRTAGAPFHYVLAARRIRITPPPKPGR